MRIRKSMKRSHFNAVILLSLVSLVAVAATSSEARTVTVFASGLDGPPGLKFGPDGVLEGGQAAGEVLGTGRPELVPQAGEPGD